MKRRPLIQQLVRGLRLAVLLAAVFVTTPTSAGSAADVVIELGDTAVNRSDLEERFDIAVRLLARQQGVSLADQDPAVIEQLRVQYLDKHATELVLLREAERRHVAMPAAKIDEALAALFPTDAERRAFLAQSGLPAERAAALLRQIVADEQTIELLREHLLEEIRIPPGDVITLHHDVKDRLATPEEVCVRHIQTETPDAADKIRAALESGAEFAELAGARSSDAATATNGGDLGCFARSASAVSTEFEHAAFAADEGDIVGPVASRLGHHVLVVYEHRMPRAPTLNEAYAEVERDLKLERLPQVIQSLIETSGMRTYPERFVAGAEDS